MKLKIVLTLAIIFLAFRLFAQAGFTISGKITEASKKPVEGATVYLLKANDSSIVKTALSDANGAYQFLAVKTGVYLVSVNMLSYEPYKGKTFTANQNLLIDVALQPAGAELKNVTVSTQRAFIQQKIDRTIVNPEALISNTGSTALEVLEKAPGVILDQNGAITMKGKSVTIFIDDKPTYLSGADLENYLKSLSSSTIDRIELMPNPPAKYEAAGNGGVINIRTKKSKVKGFNGGLNLAYGQGRYARTNNSLNFNYRNNRLNVFGNFSYNYNNSFNDLDISRHFMNSGGSLVSNFYQNSYIRGIGSNYLAKVGADYYISDKSTIGINLTGLSNPNSRNTTVTSKFTNAANQPDSNILADNKDGGVFRNVGANANFRHQFDKNGHEFSMDIDYINYYTNRDQSFNNNSYLANGSFKGGDLLTGALPAHINIYSAKADYERPLSNGVKLAAGAKTSYTSTDNIANYFSTISGTTTPDYDKTNHFIYKETISAAYINANKDFKRLSVQAGLRLESTVSNGHQLGNAVKPDSAFKKTYTNLFPTLYLQYKLDTADRNQVAFNYGRRIDRPAYQSMNPFLSPLDKFTYYTGNPFLRPSFTDNFELSHTYKNKITTTLEYSRTRDDVNETIEIANGIYYSRPGNIGRQESITLSLDASFDPAKWFGFYFHGHVSQIHSVSDFYTGKLDTKGTYFFVRPVFTFKIPKDWTIQLDGDYRSDLVSAQFLLRERGRVNAAVSKKLSSALTAKFVVNDIFYSFKNRGVINNLALTTADWVNIGDSRNFVASLSWRFGKAIQGQRKHNANATESEQNRVRN